MRQKIWSERHPFLWGMTQTFGIFSPRRRIETAQELFDRVMEDIAEAAAEAARETRPTKEQQP